MPLFLVVLLALVQGITEFLPVSSSAHLVLVHAAFGEHRPEEAAALVLDVAVHLGTLGAVLAYFRRDVARLVRTGLAGLAGLAGPRQEGWALGWMVVAAAVPVAAAGALFKDTVAAEARSVEVVAWTTLVFGLVLWAADRRGSRTMRLDSLRLPHALAIGAAQILALVPGVSRSGITMTAALALGFERAEAARFSLLLSIPVILGAGLWTLRDLVRMDDPSIAAAAGLAALLAFAAALAAIAAMMRWLARASFTPFVIYRVLLGGLLLAWVYA
ncbi:MAG: undecaprenyl-diphosphate phosphatase [Alphaproteobacteria bacterium]|nr:undecaprenyl-diphosphate phosphatase [Alphaproteobacteria bacterium]